jgi:c-di-GMP-binding flagellar brake protein YcgR
MQDGTERRKFVRLPLAIEAPFAVSGDPAGRTYEAVTRDISVGGICLEVDHDVESVFPLVKAKGARVAVDIRLPDGLDPASITAEPVWSQGKVDWVKKGRKGSSPLLIGLRFWHVPEGARERIRKLVVEKFVSTYREPPKQD